MSIKSIIAYSILLLVFTGCKSVQVVEKPVPVKETEIEYCDVIKEKNIYVHDSVYIKEKNDTVIIYKEKTRFINTTDTLRLYEKEYIEVPVEIHTAELKEVNILYWWQKILMIAGVLFIFLIGKKFLIR